MLASILASGLAVGAVYALIGITYNTMFATSRVMSFTAGQVGMLGGVFGSLFILRFGLPALAGPGADAGKLRRAGRGDGIRGGAAGAEKSRPALYVLSTLAVALLVQNLTALEWSTEPQPFPSLLHLGEGIWDEKYWLPVLACAATVVRPRIPLPPHAGRSRLRGDRPGQFRRPGAGPAGA